MSLSKDHLKQIIKEELSSLLDEEVESPKKTLEYLGFEVYGDFEEGSNIGDGDREKDIDFLKLDDGRFRMTVREEASDGGYDVSTHDHDSLDGLVQHIQQELGEDDLMEASAGPWKVSPTEAAYGVYKKLEELTKRAKAAYDEFVEKEHGFTRNMSKDQYVKNYLSIANEMGLDKALDKHRLIAREATFTRIEDPVKMSDFMLGKNLQEGEGHMKVTKDRLKEIIKEELASLLSEDSPGDWEGYDEEFPGVEMKKTGRTVWFKHPDPQSGKASLEAVLDHLTQGLMGDDPTRDISEPRWDDNKNAWVVTSTYWGSA